MMKKGIICGICAVVLLLFLTPTIPAQQYTLVKDTMEKDFQQQLNRAIAALRIMAEDAEFILLEASCQICLFRRICFAFPRHQIFIFRMTISATGETYGLMHPLHGRLFAMAYALLHLCKGSGNRQYQCHQ